MAKTAMNIATYIKKMTSMLCSVRRMMKSSMSLGNEGKGTRPPVGKPAHRRLVG
jgi:hypothetical protein